MLTRKKPVKSASGKYVAICYNSNFEGVYFKKFTMPSHDPITEEDLAGVSPSWYFLNRLNAVACIEDVITWEEYLSLSDQL